MRLLWEGPGFRRASYWVLIAAFVTLSAYAGAQAFSLQESLQEKEYERTKRELDTLLALWERAVLDRVSAWIEDVADAEDPRAVEDRYRRASRYFEAFYVWRPGASGPTFLYPEPPIEEHIETLMADSCLATAARLSDRTAALTAARAYDEPPATAQRATRRARL